MNEEYEEMPRSSLIGHAGCQYVHGKDLWCSAGVPAHVSARGGPVVSSMCATYCTRLAFHLHCVSAVCVLTPGAMHCTQCALHVRVNNTQMKAHIKHSSDTGIRKILQRTRIQIPHRSKHMQRESTRKLAPEIARVFLR